MKGPVPPYSPNRRICTITTSPRFYGSHFYPTTEHHNIHTNYTQEKAAPPIAHAHLAFHCLRTPPKTPPSFPIHLRLCPAPSHQGQNRRMRRAAVNRGQSWLLLFYGVSVPGTSFPSTFGPKERVPSLVRLRSDRNIRALGQDECSFPRWRRREEGRR